MIKIYISVTSHALDPPVTNCHTFSDPLEHDVLYEGKDLVNNHQLQATRFLERNYPQSLHTYRNRYLGSSRASLKSQAHKGTSLFTSESKGLSKG